MHKTVTLVIGSICRAESQLDYEIHELLGSSATFVAGELNPFNCTGVIRAEAFKLAIGGTSNGRHTCRGSSAENERDGMSP